MESSSHRNIQLLHSGTTPEQTALNNFGKLNQQARQPIKRPGNDCRLCKCAQSVAQVSHLVPLQEQSRIWVWTTANAASHL